MKILKYGLLLVLISISVLFSYELYRVKVAESKTDTLRSIYLTGNELDLKRIPSKWIDILLKIEDPNFYNHSGIDIRTPGAGLTTITQGLTKFMYFEKFKPGFAKIEQSAVARFVLNEYFTKEEQLEIFFNHAYLGYFQKRRVLGFSQASKIYFNKEFLDITVEEYLSLVAMLVGPDALNVIKYPQQNYQRVQRIRQVLNGTYIPVNVTDIYYRGYDA